MKKSMKYLILSSDQNNSNAQYIIGEIYYKGELVRPNIKIAMHYLILASYNRKDRKSVV